LTRQGQVLERPLFYGFLGVPGLHRFPSTLPGRTLGSAAALEAEDLVCYFRLVVPVLSAALRAKSHTSLGEDERDKGDRSRRGVSGVVSTGRHAVFDYEAALSLQKSRRVREI